MNTETFDRLEMLQEDLEDALYHLRAALRLLKETGADTRDARDAIRDAISGLEDRQAETLSRLRRMCDEEERNS